MLRTVLQSSATGVAISDFDRRSTWNNRWTCRQQSSRTIRPSPSGVTSGPVSPSAGASPDNIISLMSTPSSVRRGEENSMTTAGDYWMTADTRVGFIVTTLTGTNRAVVRFYNQRGTAEQWIKEG